MELCPDKIVDQFYNLGPFSEPGLKSTPPGTKIRDWTTLNVKYLYKGQWNEFNEPEGFGAVIMPNSHCEDAPICLYEGQVSKGQPHGRGREIFGDGCYFMGNFFEGEQFG